MTQIEALARAFNIAAGKPQDLGLDQEADPKEELFRDLQVANGWDRAC